MSHLTDILREIKDVKVLKERRGENPVVKGLVVSIATKIGCALNWDTGSAVALETAIAEASLSEELSSVLQDAGDKRTTASSDASKKPNKRSSGAPPRDQTLKACYNYFTLMDYAILDDPKTSEAKRDSIFAERLQRLGIRRASEDGLIKWSMVLLIDIEFKLTGRYPSYWQIYHRVRSLVKQLQKLPPYEGPFLDSYPGSPHELPADVFNLAYDAADQPIQRYIRNFDALGEHVPLRKSSKLLRKEGADTEPELRKILTNRDENMFRGHHSWNSAWGGPSWDRSAASSWGGGGSQSSAPLGASHYSWGYEPQPESHQAYLSSRGSWGMESPPPCEATAVSSSHGLRSFKPKLRQFTGPAEAVKTEAPDEGAEKVPGGAAPMEAPKDKFEAPPAGDGRRNSEDIEDAAFAKLAAKKEKTKTTKKKTAAAVLKKPAALKLGPKGEALRINYQVKWEKGDDDRTRNVFNCKHYNRAKIIIKHEHPDGAPEDKRVTLHGVVASAGKVFDAHQT